VLLPHLADLNIEQVTRRGMALWIHADITAQGASCPGCTCWSVRVHSRYQRCLSDAAVGGTETLICLRVRRFYCDNPDCARATFAEQVPGLTTAHARRTPLLRSMLERIALAVGGRP
ncbi:transposase family protein, partial [Nocardia amamiensis]